MGSAFLRHIHILYISQNNNLNGASKTGLLSSRLHLSAFLLLALNLCGKGDNCSVEKRRNRLKKEKQQKRELQDVQNLEPLPIPDVQKSAPLLLATWRVHDTGTRHNPLLRRSYFA